MKYFFAFFTALVLSGCDVVEGSYKTHQDAREDNLFARGWLPNILPKTTTDITVKNDLDLNTSEGDFYISVNELEDFVNKLEHISGKNYNYQGGTEKYQWLFTIDESGYVQYRLVR